MHEQLSQALADTTLEQFRLVYEREHATTRKLLHAYPADQAELKPHERSGSAREVAWIFVMEGELILQALQGRQVLESGPIGQAPASWEEVLQKFDEVHEQVLATLKQGDASKLVPIRFFVAPKQTADWAPMSFLWYFLSDQIHHRGQFSVYLRMSGGKVPSIYGPSGDEPWN